MKRFKGVPPLAELIDHISFLENLRKKHKYKKPLTIMFFVMMPNNFQELPTFLDLCLDLGIDRLVVKNQDVILKMERDSERFFTWNSQDSKELQWIIKVSLEKAQSKGLFMRIYELFPHEITVCEQDPLNTAFFNWQGYVSPCITLSYAQETIFQGRKIRAPLYRFETSTTKPLGTSGTVRRIENLGTTLRSGIEACDIV